MRFYAIRRKRDGAFMPQRLRRYGFTATEPATGCAPRLFARELDARAALRWWLKGVTTVTRRMSGGFEGDYDYDEQWNTDAVPGRNAEDMEVIPVEVIPMSLLPHERRAKDAFNPRDVAILGGDPSL